jgi:hypothetical protein
MLYSGQVSRICLQSSVARSANDVFALPRPCSNLMPMRRTLLVFSCLTMGGCLGSGPAGPALETALAPPAAETLQAPQASPAPEGKRLIELATQASVMAKLTGVLEISATRPTHDSQWGDWMFCIKSSSADQPIKYAVLIGHDAVIDVRSSVLIDGCDQETYHPLTPPKPVRRK